MGVCNCSMFCCTLLYVHFSIAIILMGKRELIALLNLSSWCLVMVERLFLTVPRGCLQFVIVVFPDHTHLLFLTVKNRVKLEKDNNNRTINDLHIPWQYYKNLSWGWGRVEKPVPRMLVWHHKACRVMTNGDPEGWIFLSYPHTNYGFSFLFTTVFIIFLFLK